MGDTPDLSGLPGWAQVVGYAIFAISGVAIWFVARKGLQMGKSALQSASQPHAEVAAVIVDPEALNRVTAAAQRIAEVLDRLTDLIGQHIADQREEREEREIDEEVERRLADELAKRPPPRAPRRRRAPRARVVKD